MDWELFVDESGDFEPNKACLVGGFLCPKGVVSETLATTWKYDIQHEPGVAEALEQFGNWKYDHCCKNLTRTKRKIINRGILQSRIANEYLERVKSIGGKFVIFDNPSGVFNTDNTTNFLTVLAKGLMMLFYDLQGDMTSLTVHFASRRNNTRQDDPNALRVSPTRVQEEGLTDEGTILAQQYVNVIKHLAFLHGGQSLLDNKVFSQMLDDIHIIGDKYVRVDYNAPFILRGNNFVYVENGGDYDKKPHPLTVPCDYICNTYIKADSFIESDPSLVHIKDIYSSENCLRYVVDRPIQVSIPTDFLNTGLNGNELLLLISQGFPEPITSRFFETLNAAEILHQRNVIDVAIQGLKEQVVEQNAMRLLTQRIKQTIEAAKYIKDDELQNYYTANLLLFLESLYTHLGEQKKVAELSETIHMKIDSLTNSADKIMLLDIADNRHIVDLTDVFDYDAAIKEFGSIDNHWKDLIAFNSRRTKEKPHFPVYGAAIGSYLQVLRHVIHSSDNEDDKALFYEEAQERYEDYLWHFAGSKTDLARCHQVICDLEAEASHFDDAIQHLYIAAQYETDIEPDSIKETAPMNEMGISILNTSGVDGSKKPYLLQHLLRTCAMMAKENPSDDRIDELLNGFIPSISQNLGSEIHSPHPKTQIQWKTASMIAYRASSTSEERRIASALFDLAAKSLQLSGTAIFSAIAVGIKAEQAMHIIEKRIPGNASMAMKNLDFAYTYFVDHKQNNTTDPFSIYLTRGNKSLQCTADILDSLINTIAY